MTNLQWAAQGEPFKGGTSFGDEQVSDDWGVRFTPTEQPKDEQFAVIDYETCVCEDPRESDDPDGDDPDLARFYVIDRTTFTICTDPEDVGGTEVWSDMVYGEGSPLFFSTVEIAEAEAARWARDFVANVNDYIYWDGRTRKVS